MRRAATVLVLLALVAAGALLRPPAARAGAVVVTDTVVDGSDGRLHELAVDSPALGRTAGVRVLLPAGYDDPANAGRRWPILWLLHGIGDDHRSWTEKSDIESMTGSLPLVVAMPEAGKNVHAGWYSDWLAGTPAWETFHLDELLPLVEARFHAGGARERRAIAGLSMGGFGTMSYAARHPDLWVSASSFSGAVCTDCYDAVGALAMDVLSPYVGTPGDLVWGPYASHELNWRGHDPVDLASNLRPLGSLAMWTGNGTPCSASDDPKTVPLELGIYPMNLALDQRLTELGITHRFVSGCGTHAWQYWTAELAATLPELMATFADPPPPPPTFDHRFVELRREVFGWTFEVGDRPQLAFTELTGVSGSGLTASGAGTLTVTTPADHPGRWRVTTPEGTEVVDGGDDQRLTFVVALSSAPATVTIERADASVAVGAAGAGDSGATDVLGATSTLPATGSTDRLLVPASALVAAALTARSLRPPGANVRRHPLR